MKFVSAMLCVAIVLCTCGVRGFAQEPCPIKSVEPTTSSVKLVALTYDDGPNDITWEILDILQNFDVAATFFVLGDRLERFPETIARIVGEGHQIGNHSYSHKQLDILSSKQLYAELDKANSAIFEATGILPTVLRPPFGALNKKVLEAAASRGMAVIHWSIDTADWVEGTSPARIAERVLKTVKEGDIILMHDLFPQTAKATKIILETLINRGFNFVTVDELIAYYSNAAEPGAVYESAIKKYDVTHGIIGDIFE